MRTGGALPAQTDVPHDQHHQPFTAGDDGLHLLRKGPAEHVQIQTHQALQLLPGRHRQHRDRHDSLVRQGEPTLPGDVHAVVALRTHTDLEGGHQIRTEHQAEVPQDADADTEEAGDGEEGGSEDAVGVRALRESAATLSQRGLGAGVQAPPVRFR